MKPRAIIRSRQDMALYINDRMNRAYENLTEEQKLEYEVNMAKVYLIEAHLAPDAAHDVVFGFLRNVLTDFQGQHKSEAGAWETDEERFFGAKIRAKGGSVELYIDASDPRFWLVHSMDKSMVIDPLLEKLISGSHELDRVWIPIQLLRCTAQLGSLRGLSLEFDRRKVPDIDFEAPEAPAEFLKMQLWGNKAAKFLDILTKNGAFPRETTLSKVKVKYWGNPEDNSEITVDDIKYDGKITARGTSFRSHNTLITNLYRKYSGKIQEIENEYSISYNVEGQRMSVRGDPIYIVFRKPIDNVELFCRYVFSSANPFKLWGVPVRVSEKLTRVSGFDLHVGKRIDFEITPGYIRVYLPAGSCGNSVVRIITNLQHYYDSQIDAQNSEGRSLLDF